ncbi:hypothetical protein [Actinomadura hibisca]|uniref:hypothetical protein n=1 Tax=Actinomadura hibisca TaxID=68565 RepID=UPI0012FC8E29|nr:hypothetical protein [Actinomadura hibisca]
MRWKHMAEWAQAALVAIPIVLAGSITWAVAAPEDGPVPVLSGADRDQAADIARRRLLALNTTGSEDPGQPQGTDVVSVPCDRLDADTPFCRPSAKLAEARVSTLVVTGSGKTPEPWVALMAVVRGKAAGVDTARRYDVVMERPLQGWRPRYLGLTPGPHVAVGEARSGAPTEESRFIDEAEEVMGAVIGAPHPRSSLRRRAPDLSRLIGDAPQQYARLLARTGQPPGLSGGSVRRTGIIRRNDRSAEVLMFINLGGFGSPAASALALKATLVRTDGTWKISKLVDA